MRITSIALQDIRCFTSLSLDLDRAVTLIFGTNGVGKSTVIDAIAAGLSAIPGVGTTAHLQQEDLRVETMHAGGAFRRERVAEGSYRVQLILGTKTYTLERTLVRGQQPTTAHHGAFVQDIQQRVSRRDRILPVLAVYVAHRSWQDHQHRDPLPIGRLSGYDGALAAGTNLAHLRAWWRDQDHRRASDFATPSLDAAESAIVRFLGGSVGLPQYSLDEQDIVIEMPETKARLCLRELSDGYRGMVAMVADIARRMSQLNPDLESDLLDTTPGVVAIDELDLHLHPNWQRSVLPQLRSVFPEVQFVVTSHSPQVLASVDSNDEVIGLSLSGEAPDAVWPVVGRDSNAILAEVMGDRERPQSYQQKLDNFYTLIDNADFQGAQNILAALEAIWGHDEPTLVQARWALEAEEE